MKPMQRLKKFLAENISKLHAVAQELLVKEKLEGADFEEIIARPDSDEIDLTKFSQVKKDIQ